MTQTDFGEEIGRSRQWVAQLEGAKFTDRHLALTANDLVQFALVLNISPVELLGASSRTVQAVHNTLSRCLKDAMREEVIRQIAGHSTVLSTRNYMHVSTDQARRALESFTLGGG